MPGRSPTSYRMGVRPGWIAASVCQPGATRPPGVTQPAADPVTELAKPTTVSLGFPGTPGRVSLVPSGSTPLPGRGAARACSGRRGRGRRLQSEILAAPSASGCRVLILTTFDLDQYVYAALTAGASGFLLKDVSPEQLVPAVRMVRSGDALLAPSITRRLVERFAPPAAGRTAAHANLSELTPRELEVLRLMAHGLSNADLAVELTPSEATIKTHVARILAKLQLRDRVQAVVAAHETGLVGPAASGPDGDRPGSRSPARSGVSRTGRSPANPLPLPRLLPVPLPLPVPERATCGCSHLPKSPGSWCDGVSR